MKLVHPRPVQGLVIVATVAALAAVPSDKDGAAPVEPHRLAPTVSWRPDPPAQGRLFMLRVESDDSRAIEGVSGEAAGEQLHFGATTGGAFESLVPVPVDAEGSIDVPLQVAYADGTMESISATVPVTPGTFEHERLTVAPRFGSPLNEADRERLVRDSEKARSVSSAAHRTERLWTDELVLPRQDRVTSGFGDGREFNGQISSRHMGLDLDGEQGDTAYAVSRGIVSLVEEFLLAGNIVYLNHGAGLLSGYFHLSEQLVSVGDTVAAGTPIGLIGATGRVTGPHLHWVVRYGRTSVDPRSLLELSTSARAPGR